jgi:nitroreductase
MGFGIKKIMNSFKNIDKYLAINPDSKFCLLMFCDAIGEYIDLHHAQNFTSPEIQIIENKLNILKGLIEYSHGKFGGTILSEKSECTINKSLLEKVFNARHSVREFSGEKIIQNEIEESIKLAQKAPSACNRQAVRIYIISSDELRKVGKNNMEGIGGFADSADKFIIVTGKISAYRLNEKNQYIVSAAIFSSYLTIALQAYSIGTCIIQRPLHFSKQWNFISKEFNIPRDESMVLLIALGKMKDKFKTPVSRRFPIQEIVRYL